ncbi:MAG: hypothetical protein H6937_09530 [Burkholderiales bacterium]|nr:hypothetical protein [Burkholderiales bacterium]
MNIVFHPAIPNSIDLANTATVRIGIMLTDTSDDLPTTGEITPGTISIDRKSYGAPSWTSVVSDAAMSENAGFVYYDEVFDSASGYDINDSIRITFKSVSVNDGANTFEVIGSAGVMFQTHIRQEFPANFKDLLVTFGTGWITVGTNMDKDDYFIFSSGTKTTLDDLQDISTTQVNTEVDTALSDIHLDHLLAVDYDPATKPGAATALLNELVESDGGVSRLTKNALRQTWATLIPGSFAPGTAGKVLGDNINATISSRATQTSVDTIDGYLDTEIAAILAAVDTEVATIVTAVAAIQAKTDSLTFTDAGKVDATIQAAADIKTAPADKIADHTLRRNLATALASSDGDTKEFRSLVGAIAKLVNKVSISGGTLTVTETDDVTTLGTQAVTTDQSAAPIVTIDTD